MVKSNKYVFVVGGCLSSLGKGITAASIARLFKLNEYSVNVRKFDPYLNVNAADIDVKQHGEVFYTVDNTAADLDLGHYERFTGIEMNGYNTVTMGRIYQKLLENQANKIYDGQTIQIIPHVTDLIKTELLNTNDAEINIIELGGTVGDMEGLPYLEAVRQLTNELNFEDYLIVFLTYVPYLNDTDGFKTKPTQYAVNQLRSMGLNPDVIMCRSQHPLNEGVKKKVSKFCGVPLGAVISNYDVSTIYNVPYNFYEQNLYKTIQRKLNLHLTYVPNYINDSTFTLIKICIVGEYVYSKDCCLTLVEQLTMACYELKLKPEFTFVAQSYDENFNTSEYDLVAVQLNDVNDVTFKSKPKDKVIYFKATRGFFECHCSIDNPNREIINFIGNIVNNQ